MNTVLKRLLDRPNNERNNNGGNESRLDGIDRREIYFAVYSSRMLERTGTGGKTQRENGAVGVKIRGRCPVSRYYSSVGSASADMAEGKPKTQHIFVKRKDGIP